MSVGLTIKRLRQEKGLTQEELGALLGVKKAAVQKYESGQVQNLKQATIKRLCEIFEMNPSVFIFNSAELVNEEQLAREVGLLEEIQRTYGKDVIELLQHFVELDDAGRLKVLDYASDLSALQSLRNNTH